MEIAQKQNTLFKTKTNSLTDGSEVKSILLFSLPLLLLNVLQQVFYMTDSIFAGRVLGQVELASVTATTSLIFLFNCLFIGVGLGATIVVSQYYGAKDKLNIQSTVDNTYFLLLVIAVPITLIGFFSARPLLMLLQTPSEVLENAVLYMRINMLGTVAVFGFTVNSNIMQGMGDSVSPLIFLAGAVVLNIGLNFIFVVCLGWGIMGLASATVVCNAFAFVFSVVYINTKNKIVRIRTKIQISRDKLKKVLRVGLPAGFQNMLFTVGALAMQNLINKQGQEMLAAFGAGSKIDMLSFLIIISFSSALTAFVGQNIGAEKLHRVKKGINGTLLISTLLSTLMAGIIILFSKQLTALFITDDNIIKLGQSYLYQVMPFYAVLSLLFLLNAAARGANKALMPMVSSIVSIVLRVGSAYIIFYVFSPQLIFLSYGIGWIAASVIIAVYMFSGNWKHRASVIKE